MENNKITIALDRADWCALGKILTKSSKKMVDIMPLAVLLDALEKAGIDLDELK